MASVTKMQWISARVPAELAERLSAAAAASERSVSAEIRLAVKAHLERAEQQEAKAS